MHRLLILAGLILASTVGLAQAETTSRDIDVLGRTFNFLENRISGSVPTAIVYDSSNAASQTEATAIQGLLGNGLSVGGATLTPVMVDVSSISDISGYRVAIVTGGMSGHYASILAAAQSGNTLTVSTDISCVQGGSCVMGVQSAPSVEIYVNRSAAESCGVGFQQAFRMMINEI